MAKKGKASDAKPLLDGPLVVPRELSSGVQDLFLPRLVVAAAHNAQIGTYAGTRASAFEVFQPWAQRRSIKIFQYIY